MGTSGAPEVSIALSEWVVFGDLNKFLTNRIGLFGEVVRFDSFWTREGVTDATDSDIVCPFSFATPCDDKLLWLGVIGERGISHLSWAGGERGALSGAVSDGVRGDFSFVNSEQERLVLLRLILEWGRKIGSDHFPF